MLFTDQNSINKIAKIALWTILMVSSDGFANSCDPANTALFISDGPHSALNNPITISVQVAGTSFPFYLSANRAGSCILDSGYSGTKNIKFCLEYSDPSSGTLPIELKVDKKTYQIGSSYGCQIIPIQFKQGGIDLFQNTLFVTYKDVGKINVTAEEVGNSNRKGQSGPIIIKPDHFDISGEGIPGTTTDIGSPFQQGGKNISAGTPFSVIITARGSNNEMTPNFGNEKNPEKVKLSSESVVLPTEGGACQGKPCNGSGNMGIIKTISSQTKKDGQLYGTFSMDEVGSFNVVANIESGNYLGYGGDVSSQYPTVIGRFIPDHFEIILNAPEPTFQPAQTNGTQSFTYIEQAFQYRSKPSFIVIAKAATGNITKNYTGSLWKLNLVPESQKYLLESEGPKLDGSLALAAKPICVSTDYGKGTCTFGEGASFRFIKNRSAPRNPIAPFRPDMQLQITVADDDGVLYKSNPFTFGIAFYNKGNLFYHGRMVVQNVTGSSLTPLAVPLVVQYYDGKTFIKNSADNETEIKNLNNIKLNTKGNAGHFQVSPPFKSAAHFTEGENSVVLSAPSPENATGNVEIEIDLSTEGENLPWLQYDWHYESIYGIGYSDNPMGTATFLSK